MNPEDMELIRALVLPRTGAALDASKTYLAETRLAPLARREGLPSVEAMLQSVRVNRDERLMWAIAEAMTYNETSFFRDRAPFALFRDEMLPALARKRGDRPLRVWSAACSTGQEPYSLAMIVDEERPKLGGARVELFGSDLSERCLEKAQSGLYTQFEVQRGLPIRHLVRYFERSGESWALLPHVRQMVRWRRINLLADLRALGTFDVIFCRNVISGLEEPARRRVLAQLAQALPPDGRLVLGLDETVGEFTDAFQPVPGRRGLYAPDPNHRRAA